MHTQARVYKEHKYIMTSYSIHLVSTSYGIHVVSTSYGIHVVSTSYSIHVVSTSSLWMLSWAKPEK